MCNVVAFLKRLRLTELNTWIEETEQMGKIIGWIAVIVIGSAIYGAFTDANRDESGTVIESGNLDVFEIRLGDCLTEEGLTTDEVSSAEAIPCTDPHMYQAYYIGNVSLSEYSSAVGEKADEICYIQFQNLYGVPIDETSLTFVNLVPTIESWASGDREITCLLQNYDESLLTESLV